MKFRLNNRVYYGLHTKTWASIIILAELVLMVSVVGFSVKQKEAYAQAQGAYNTFISHKLTYTEPTIDYTQSDRAIRIIKNTWGKDYKVGLAIARCESGYREKVVNSIGATGFFQILVSVHNWTVQDMQNGVANASYAYTLYLKQGLNPWSASRDCWEGEI